MKKRSPDSRRRNRVAVAGIGGLGHLAVQFLSKWGCEVTATSSSREKEKQARGFGARDFFATQGTNELQKAARSFDFILNTVSANLPWEEYMAALCPGSKLCVVGIESKRVAVAPVILPAKSNSWAGYPG